MTGVSPFTIILALSYFLQICGSVQYITRKTTYGYIRGIEEETVGKTVELFLGVPYAEKPLGDLRFEYPRKPCAWSDVLNTTSLPAACPQRQKYMDYIQMHRPGFDRTSEDCLYLNIFVPKVKKIRRHVSGLPVLVWIHGGSNEAGMGAMLPGNVLAAVGEIIVVNFNYRLDALGFLSFEDNEMPGNYGLLDQVAVLEWIKSNIREFSGDPDRVTLAGHSAGALDVGIHMLSPLTKGLFRNAILQSGSAIAFWSTITDEWRRGYRRDVKAFLNSLGCPLSPTKDVKLCLRKRSVDEIAHGSLKRLSGIPILHPIVIDNYILPEEPLHLLTSGKSHAQSVMLGFTRDEGVQFLSCVTPPSEDTFTFDHAKKKLPECWHHPEVKGNLDLVFHEYINWRDPDNKTDLVRSIIEMYGDRGFAAPAIRTADLISTSSSTPVYVYTFEFVTPSPFEKDPFLQIVTDMLKDGTSIKDVEKIVNAFSHQLAIVCDTLEAVPHGRDMFYLFGLPLVGHADHIYGEADKEASRAYMRVTSNFVKNGLQYNVPLVTTEKSCR